MPGNMRAMENKDARKTGAPILAAGVIIRGLSGDPLSPGYR
jgi:hypothetical protein